MSGYISRCESKEIYVLEDRCSGKGDAGCHLIGRTREEWGEDRADELHFFEENRLEECLNVSLHRVTETLKAAERKLRER
jgi:two-component system, NtrC family, response regulator HydG